MHFGEVRISFEDDPLDIDQDMHSVKVGLKYKF
jgi:opacity protein-like surface antigen